MTSDVYTTLMDLEKELQQLPRQEKIRLMETLWRDLLRDDPSLPSPAWHQDELHKAEEALKAGEDDVVDWEDAKKILRKAVE